MNRRPRAAETPTSDADAALLSVLSRLLAAPKRLAIPAAWRQDDGDLRLSVPLDIDAVTVPGLTLFGRATATLPDRKVTLGLRWQDPVSIGGNFDRLEWRPLKAHTNRANAPPELRLRVIDGSHHHPFALNAALDIGLGPAIRENLPIAAPLVPDPVDWNALLEMAAVRWHIEDLLQLPPPPWQYDLLIRSAAPVVP